MTAGNVPVPGWNAHRRPQNALRPPKYRFQDVPKCQRNLEGSVLMEVVDHEKFKEIMGEMVLLCTEALRRSNAARCYSKPLSLEYIADRLDVDDPCFGYMVRSKEGHLQGFVTVTTFTNWQKNFRWDSLHDHAFYYDESDTEDDDNDAETPLPQTKRNRPRRDRQVDRDGSLSKQLQQTVRLGDPYNEGIVWPRIAEVALLGALGCGRTLMKLIIEQLEFQKASPNANYDYIALQATDNSIPFYESLGFVRVGAVTSVQNKPQERSDTPISTTSDESAAVDAIPLEPSSPDKPDALAMPSEVVTSPKVIHTVKKPGETPSDIAKRYKTNAWDIIFFNKDIYPDLSPKSRLKKGTVLHVPLQAESNHQDDVPTQQQSPTKWFVAKENDTPRKIAKKFGLPCKKLVDANLPRLPELQPASRLKAGTRVKVSNLDRVDEVCDPYCHWSFPDDSVVEGGEPSYMMVYKLDRKTARNPTTVRNSLAVPIVPYEPPKLLLPRPQPQPQEKVVTVIKQTTPKVPPPKPPPEPQLASDIFKQQQRDTYPHLREATEANELILDNKWEALSQTKKNRYNSIALEGRKHYDHDFREYEVEYEQWKREHEPKPVIVESKDHTSLFNKVVKIHSDALDGKDYSYWFVLTYIPDLMWCHLAPMVQDGFFGPEKKKSNGRPKWRLVDEKHGKEIDVSSIYCIPVKSKAMKKTADADKEEWDILDHLKSCDVSDSGTPAPSRIHKQPIRARTATKPMNSKIAVVKPIHPAPVSETKEVLVASPRPPSRRTPVRSTPPRVSPRWTPITNTNKRMADDVLGPERQKRKIHNAGARRSILQS